MFCLLLFFGVSTFFGNAEVIKECIMNLFFLGAGIIVVIGMLKVFKEAFTGNGKGV
jgi:hypothetical protein